MSESMQMNKALALEILRQATENTPMVRKSHHAVEAALIYLDRATVETKDVPPQAEPAAKGENE